MPMKIEVCPVCKSNNIKFVNQNFDKCLDCSNTKSNYAEINIVYTERELKQAKIQSYEQALHFIETHTVLYALRFIKNEIKTLNQEIKEAT